MPDKRRELDEFTDEQLDRMAEITDDDIARAQDAWERDAPPEFRRLLDAEPAPESEEV